MHPYLENFAKFQKGKKLLFEEEQDSGFLKYYTYKKFILTINIVKISTEKWMYEIFVTSPSNLYKDDGEAKTKEEIINLIKKGFKLDCKLPENNFKQKNLISFK